ncbi:MAG: XRE family transcriptional regulator [Patescibacteria group bacterium]
MKAKINKIYIAGALTNVKEEDKNLYEKLASFCKSLSSEIYVPHLWRTDPIKHPKVLPEDVWKINQGRIANSDLVIAYVGKPSLGVGAELELARINNVAIIIWWFKGEKVSRMALGNPAIIKQIQVKKINELFEKLKLYLNNK